MPGADGEASRDSAGSDEGGGGASDGAVATWKLLRKLTPASAEPGRLFGTAIAASDEYLVVGAPGAAGNTGAVFLYRLETITEDGTLSQGANVGSNFGVRVAVSGDTVLVGALTGGANGGGAAFAFRRSASGWTQEATFAPADIRAADRFGTVALVGDYALIGAAGSHPESGGSGSVYDFRRTGTKWEQYQTILPQDTGGALSFGASITMSASRAVVGGRGAYVYDFESGNWKETAWLAYDPANELSQGARATAGIDDVVAVGSLGNPSGGHVFVFSLDGQVWSMTQQVDPPVLTGDTFGSTVALGSGWLAVAVAPIVEGETFPYAGSVDLFRSSLGNWTYVEELKPETPGSPDRFGRSVVFNGRWMFIGAPFDSVGGDRTGAVYVYHLE